MADKPAKFEIPPVELVPGDDTLAVQEVTAFDRGWELKSSRAMFWLTFLLKIALFVFVLGLNAYWAHNVILMVWKSGMPASSFHLSDSVLIALVTTSIANFIALVVIVAKHLFPSGS
ncbi:MAG TPA: hypothetical protein VGR55_00515 [Candidatus Acidoferrum sp.]|nr:hypothetical protein [Candidatus Acidoferrum sp.]